MTPEEQKEFETLEEYEKIVDSYCEMQMTALGSTDKDLRAGLEADFKASLEKSGMTPIDYMNQINKEVKEKDEAKILEAEKVEKERLEKEEAEKAKILASKKSEPVNNDYVESGLYLVLKRFYVRVDGEKVITVKNDTISGRYISEEHCESNLVKRIK